MGTLLALPLDDHAVLEDKGMFAALRDEFKQLFAQTATPSKPETLGDELKTGPYSNVVLALYLIIQACMIR